ncbi:hypothetical protein Trydic_g8823 [Trypoxylus dichotomus]
MRSPEQRIGHRAGRNFENELSLRYLSPGAFTVLPPHEYGSPPDAPTAPEPYRLTPNSRRRRAQAFSIIAETSSNPGTRSPSPTGRVSPFRGRGFNPIGSRHASPIPSPPPSTDTGPSAFGVNYSPRKSQIPQPTRKQSAIFYGGKVTATTTPKFRRKNGAKLSPHLSKSLTNLSSKNVSSRPLSDSQNTYRRYTKRPAFEQLSPITGSSPENGTVGNKDNNKSQSSPSKIPKATKSQPASRKSSPTRALSPLSNSSSKQNSRPGSKTVSQNISNDSSRSQTKIPIKHSYKDISAKINTFNKFNKPKVPQKPQDIKNGSERSRSVKGKLSRKQSIGKILSEKLDEPSTSHGYSSHNVDAIHEISNEDEDDNDDNNHMHQKVSGNQNGNDTGNKSYGRSLNDGEDITKAKDDGIHIEKSDIHKSESSSKLIDLPTATTVVSSTATTAAQPLKLDTNIEDILKEELQKQTYSNDGRVLSATSVSSAMNKMNDTVLNSQTLLKEHGQHSFAKLSPAATAIISLSNENHKGNKALDTKTATTALPTIESIHKKLDDVGQNINNSFSDSNKVHMESIENTVKNNINKTLTPDHNNYSGSYIQKSANERLREARTMVAADVKPIKILVKEKPSEIEVQSGNVRLPSSVSNGLTGIPSLPPPQHHENEVHSDQEQEQATVRKKNCCSRLLARCKFKRCRRKLKQRREKSPVGCFNCKRRQREAKEGEVDTDRSDRRESTGKKRILNRLKCCGSKKNADSRQRRNSCLDKGNTTSTKFTNCRDRCKYVLRCIFCCSCCRKKKIEDEVSRRESMMSKKKSLTPTTVPPVDTLPKIDVSLVEHSSLMRGAIPVLPVALAWICLLLNVFLPGTGTVLSGMFCLCLGKPRFSQYDGPRPRIGAFLIDLIIGCGQLFTVLFCLVGWGWSIWWGVIMLKIARKHKRIRLAEERALGQIPVVNENHHSRDPERGS